MCAGFGWFSRCLCWRELGPRFCLDSVRGGPGSNCANQHDANRFVHVDHPGLVGDVYRSGGCQRRGAGGSTPVLHGSYVYARGDFDPPLILAKSSGAATGTFASVAAPAFDSTNMYTRCRAATWSRWPRPAAPAGGRSRTAASSRRLS